MNADEIRELLVLRNWSRERLAVEMHVSVASIHSWIREGEAPDGPVSLLLRIWLREARGELQIVEISQRTKRKAVAV